ncbi:RICIN domain-containing protein [Actinosynnema sp. ALI-1.44]|uniref:RICIN domain-containing protein n=1 Tax=Actinosynnema sp. ALI-1.44 TaxID=1933779 RepID=UPI00143DDD07|nr:RICIN domain-containing protein [Actinosynnema sp. ALI-1.44]
MGRLSWKGAVTAAAALLAAAGLTSAPAAAQDSTAAPMALIQLSFTSVGSGERLDVKKSGSFDNGTVVVAPAPGSAQSWRINTAAGDGAFAIVNETANKCLDARLNTTTLQACDGRASEKWYFQPVNGSAQKAFMLRHEADGLCLGVKTDFMNNKAGATEACNGSPTQQWVLPEDVYSVAYHSAVDFAAARCAKDRATCSWSTGVQTPPFLMPATCVSPVWFNGTSTSIPWTFSLTTSTGWKNTIGFSLQAKLTVGMEPLQAEVSATVHGEISMDLKQDLGNSLVVTVPPRQYGWVALSELATKVTGKWTFDTQGFPWTAEDEITVPLKYDPNGGASIYSARTSPTFTSCDAQT